MCAGVYLCFSMTDNPPSDVVRVKLKRVTRRPSTGDGRSLLYAMKMKSNLYNEPTAVFENEASKSIFFFPILLFFQNFLLLPSFVSAFSFCQWNEILYRPYSSKALQISV